MRFDPRKTMKLIGARRSALETAQSRLAWVRLGFALAYVLVAIRVADLTIIQGEMRPSRDAEMAESLIPDPEPAPVRADIMDRNGVILATSLKTPSLYADPALIPDPEKTAQQLAEILPGLNYGDTLQKLQRQGRFIWIKRNITPAEQFEVLKLGEPGLNFKEEWQRIYPQGNLASHLVGYTDVDSKGLGGIEHSFNKLLAGGGQALTLSLDVRIQHIMRRELQEAIKTYNAKAGTGVVLDMASGEILAGVSLPDFDPHDISRASQDNLFNRLTLGSYELGSTFKAFSTAALLEFTGASLSDTFDATKSIKRSTYTISDYHAEKRILTVPEVFIHSSNIGAALMAEKVGKERLRDFYKDLGFDRPLSLELSEIGKPQFPKPWRDIHTVTASYGHGIAVSPLQMVVAAASIVGDGTLMQPTLINHGNAIKESQNRPDIRVVSPQTAHRLRQLMRLTVTDGTGGQADVPGYQVGGKTGTADKPERGGYSRTKKLSSFLGFFPMEAPRYAVFIMVDEPTGTKESYGYATGGWVAAPAVGDVIASMAAVLGIEPGNTEEADSLVSGLKRYIGAEIKKQEGAQLVSY